MLLGLIRSGIFAINAGLVFLLSQQAPQLGRWQTQPQFSALVQTRNGILAGLGRVRADLETNGKLLTRVRHGAEPARGLGQIKSP